MHKPEPVFENEIPCDFEIDADHPIKVWILGLVLID